MPAAGVEPVVGFLLFLENVNEIISFMGYYDSVSLNPLYYFSRIDQEKGNCIIHLRIREQSIDNVVLTHAML